MLTARFLQPAVATGDLRLIDWRGQSHRLGDGTGDSVAAEISDRATDRALAFNPYLRLGEAYMDGRLRMVQGEIADLLALLGRNLGSAGTADHWLHRLLRGLRIAGRRLQQYNPVGRAQANVAHHYDLDGALYDLFLDSDKQYSCAYFAHDDDSLERAQAQKKQHIAAKLCLEPGMSVLDIGCGWGGMALYLAKECDIHVVGVTLSKQQAGAARARAEAAGLQDRVDIQLKDYRELSGPFDRIVSVGMFEHVGVNHYQAFYETVRRRLDPAGVALIHHIARSDGPGTTNPWMTKYIFPGGYSPALSEVLPPIEDSGLYTTDLEIWRLHYAKTLAHWRRRFTAAWDDAAKLYDERFCRMWEFYLAGSEMSFRYGGHVVAQIQLARDQAAVPLSRDYIEAFKRAHPVTVN